MRTDSVTGISATNRVVIAPDQVVRVVALTPFYERDPIESPIHIWKSGGDFYAQRGDVIVGPALFVIQVDDCTEALLTLKFLPGAVDPGKTLILPQSSNAVSVAMEWSTNLAHWSEGTNGLYSTADAAKFFRVKVQP